MIVGVEEEKDKEVEAVDLHLEDGREEELDQTAEVEEGIEDVIVEVEIKDMVVVEDHEEMSCHQEEEVEIEVLIQIIIQESSLVVLRVMKMMLTLKKSSVHMVVLLTLH